MNSGLFCLAAFTLLTLLDIGHRARKKANGADRRHCRNNMVDLVRIAVH